MGNGKDHRRERRDLFNLQDMEKLRRREVSSKRSLVEEKQALQVRREISLNVLPHFRELKCLQLILCILRDLLLNDSIVRYARTRLRPRPLFLLQLQQTSSWHYQLEGQQQRIF